MHRKPAPPVNEPVRAEPDPPGLRPPGAGVPAETTGAGQNNPYRVVWALLGFVVALTLVVLVILPVMVAERTNDVSGPDLAVAPAVTTPPLAAGVARHDAEQALQGFLRLRAQPDLAGAETWAAEPWQAAMDRAAAGDEQYGRGHFGAAQSAYQDATEQLSALLASRGQRLTDNLAAGQRALANNEVALATEAFERVLAIRPGHAEASLGLARAQARPALLAFMEEGSEAETREDLPQAADAYTKGVELDSAFEPAQAALRRVNQALAGQAFQQAMSHALASLDRADYPAAKDALDAAAQIRPTAPALKDARLRLLEGQRQSALADLRNRAERQTAAENWERAAELYRKALAIDSHAAFAETGLTLAQKRGQLHAQFDHYLADTTRLAFDEPLENARRLLAANQHMPANEPRLANKRAALQEAVRLAVQPVELVIRSDEQTEVTIYHAGRFGRFTEKRVMLRPGRYTVTGHRAGYRDVRRVVTLQPDSPSQTLQIRCEEPI